MAHNRKKSNNRRYRPYRERYVSPKTKWAIGLIALAVIGIGLLSVAFLKGWITLPQPQEETPETTVATQPPEDTVIHIVAGGDVNVTEKVIGSGENGSYEPVFRDVLPVLANADLTVLNFEGNVYGEADGQLRSAPKELLAALKNAGVDVLQTANSQAITNGMLGLASTAQAIREAGMEPLGTYADEAEFEKYQGYLLYEINGIRVALVAFTKGMDGRNLLEGNERSVNLLYTDYSSTYQSINTEGITQVLTAVEQAKPDVTVALLHWGSEYNDTVNSTQTRICSLLESLGVDAIVGTHPHYVQKMGIDGETGQFVAYSLGDLTGDAELSGTDYSVLLDLEITRDGATGQVSVTGYDYTPVYLAYGEDGTLRVLRIKEAVAAYENNNVDRVSEEMYKAMKNALVKIEKRVEATK